MKQNLQQTVVQRALQPVARSIPTGLEQFDMADTEEQIQTKVDDNESLLEVARRRETTRDDYLQGVLDNASQSQIEDMMSYRTARSGNLRGSSSGSASSFIPQQAASFLSTASATASGDPTDIPFEEVSPIPLDVKIDDLNKLTEQHILNIQKDGGDNSEVARLQKKLNAITTNNG
jgi:hypothetical protein